jgi:hypothetical protein
LPNAIDREARFERAWGVVQPSVEHAAVVGTLMLADPCFFLEDDDAPMTIGVQQLVCSREPDDTAPDNDRS